MNITHKLFIHFFIPLISLFFISTASISAEQTKKGMIDLVALGKKLSEEKGCVECHSVKKNDSAFKTGPNLYGVFQVPAARRTIQQQDGTIATITADIVYLQKSLGSPAAELAIQTKGTEKGQAFFPIMPKFNFSGLQVKSLLAYFQTLNQADQSGPKKVWKKAKNNKAEKPLYDHELWVGTQATFDRHHIAGLSTRPIHIALPNNTNYSFDSQNMAIKKIWSGGFLDLTSARTNRGQGLNYLAKNSLDWQITPPILPLTQALTAVDLSFKTWPTFKTPAEVGKYHVKQQQKSSAQPYLHYVNAAKGRFLGIDHSNKSLPALNFSIEGVHYQQRVSIEQSGVITYQFKVNNAPGDIAFKVDQQTMQLVQLSHGFIKDGIWRVPSKFARQFSITLKTIKSVNMPAVENKTPAYSHDTQAVIYEGDQEALLPAGYQAQSIMAPKDRFGRSQLFEPLGIDFAANGTAVIATRTAGIWRIIDDKWQFFAAGFYDPLGVYVEDLVGDQIVVAHKPELTRVKNINKEPQADLFETINDDWRFAGNYAEYVHGPVPDGEGGYFLNLNLAVGGDKVGGSWMGSYGGYDGWLVHIDKNGTFEPWANGLRSPAGLGYGANNLLLYTDNQGSYVGTSKMHIVEKGQYYGYPASLIDTEEHRGKDIDWREVNKKAALAEIYFPHGIVANSPGNPTYDSTQGKFGPFAGQILVGDQTLSNISRVTLEKVHGQWQGAVMPFISNLKSGAMRLTFAPDNSLWIGQTGRGWSARGGSYEALQRITWDGKTTPFEIKDVNLINDGFKVSFTDKFDNSLVTAQDIEISSWRYTNTPVYGSPRYDLTKYKISQLDQSNNALFIKLENMKAGLIYEIKINNIRSNNGLTPSKNTAYYTLHKLK